MTATVDTNEFDEMLALYAVNALDESERAAVERAIEEDDVARRDLARFVGATALLHEDEGPGPDVWASILDAVGETERSNVVIPIEFGKRARTAITRRPKIHRIAIAASVAAALAFAAVAFQERDTVRTVTTAASIERAAAAAATNPRATQLVLVTAAGETTDVAVLPTGRGYVVSSTVPKAERGRYVLLGINGDKTVLLAVLGRRIATTAFLVPRGVVDLVLAIDIDGERRPIAIRNRPSVETGTDPAGTPGATTADPAAPNSPSAAPQPSNAPTDSGSPSPLITLPELPITLPAIPALPGLPTVTIPKVPGLRLPFG